MIQAPGSLETTGHFLGKQRWTLTEYWHLLSGVGDSRLQQGNVRAFHFTLDIEIHRHTRVSCHTNRLLLVREDCEVLYTR